MATGILEFGEFQLDCERFELRRNGLPLRLERKPLELLILLASSGGRLVTRPEIARCLWDTEVFVDTEHGINTAIRKIRHALREDPESPRFLQTVTGKGYRFVGVTPKPEPAPSPTTQPDQPIQPPVPQPVVPIRAPASRSHLWVVASASAVVLILFGIATFGARNVRGHTSKPAITSIAVLPLDNLSGDPAQDYLADGMTDELTTMLAKNSTLRVISRTSVMQYKGAHRPLPEIARQLNVDGIVEGSLARTGDDLHMTLQLIQAPTDTHLWADSYDRNANDLVSLPHDAAVTIARETHSSIPSAAKPKYINPAAHDAYLRGNFHWFTGDQAGAGQYYLKATQIQPDYAAAWAGLSSSYGAGTVDYVLDPREAIPLAVSAGQKAIDLDPSLPEAHVAFGAAKYWLNDWNLEAAKNEFTRATELNPQHSQAWHMIGKLLIQQNRYQEGMEMERKAMELNPFQRPWGMVYAYFTTRQYDAAITDAKQRLETHTDPIIWWMLSRAYDAKHMDKESEHALEQFYTLTNRPDTAETLHRAFARGGRDSILRWQIGQLNAKAGKGYASPYKFASYYAELGDKQQALGYLDECMRNHDPTILDIQNDAAFDALHSDPHYRAIIQKTGLPPAW